MAREKRTYGFPVNVEIHLYPVCKYSEAMRNVGPDEERFGKYEGVEFWEIVSGDDAAEMESHTDGSCIDPLHEYLVLHFTNGNTATYRNSCCDMFRIP